MGILPEIQIGQAVDIVIEHGVIRASSVQDIVEGRIVLLQIAPPLSTEYIDKTILVTYLLREDRHVRRCFQARIVDIHEGYVTVGRGFPVIIAEPLEASKVCDLRVHERHRPAPDMKILFGADLLEIVDISSGGAHLVRSTGTKPTLRVDETILLTIHNSNGQYEQHARIVRLWHSRGADGPQHLAVAFWS